MTDYPGYPYPRTHPDRLGRLAQAFGLRPQGARVLEIGCGDGMNVVGMAAGAPELAALGIDVWDAALERGRAVASELELPNVTLRTLDVRAAEDLGTFDFVIAHGVYSWTPPDVRDATLALAARSLAPHGVAFVSFLCHPGGFLRTMAREIGLLAEEPEAIYGELLSLVEGRPDPYARALEFELRRIASRPRASLFHDDLAEAYAPVWLKDFVAHAEGCGLRRLCEADAAELRPGWMPLEIAQRLDGLPALERDQMADVIAGRAYREAVLCRADAPATDAPDLAVLDVPPRRRWSPEPGERPVVFPLARLQAARGIDVTNLRHEHLRLDDEAARELLTLMDGTRPRSAFPDRALRQIADLALLVAEDPTPER